MTSTRPFLFLLLGLGLSSCTPGDLFADPADSEAPLSDLDALMDGAPTNDELPADGKFDGEYPAQFDLISTQSPVKSQGSRGVCSIFSTVGLMEHLYIKEGTLADPDFSEQFLQWSTKEELRAFRNTGGSNANSNLRAISQYGIVTEAVEPYQSQPWGTSNDEACTGDDRPVQCHTNGDPSEAALAAERWKLPAGRYVNSRENSIKAYLTENDTAVVAGMTFFYQSWNHRSSELPTNSKYWSAGYVLSPNAVDKEKSLAKRAGHSILIVGWDDDLEVAKVDEKGDEILDAEGNPVMEKGFWLFKNSWGTTGFGINNEFGAGYGWLSMDYVTEYGSIYSSRTPELNLSETCDDGLDNDFNGNVDCADPSCDSDAACQVGGLDYSNKSRTSVPDNDSAGAMSIINVDQPGTAGVINVTVNIEHTYIGDLKVSLISPDGTVASLHNKTGGSTDNIKKTWALDDFVGESIDGSWTLNVVDTAGSDTGAIVSWDLALQLEGDLPAEDCDDAIDNDADGATDCADSDCSSVQGCEGATTLTGSADTAVNIPDNAPNGASTTINISESATISALSVDVDITHAYRGDLTVELTHPDGDRVLLHDRQGADADNLLRTYTPSGFDGLGTSGVWTLTVIDGAAQDAGVLNSWSLEIDTE